MSPFSNLFSGLVAALLTAYAVPAHAGLLDGIFGKKPAQESAQAPAEVSAQAMAASFSDVAPNGANLREKLVQSDAVRDVIPYGKSISWVVPKQNGGGLTVSRANGDALDAIAGACKTQWLVKMFKQDPMSNQVSHGWVPLAADDHLSRIYKRTDKNPRSGQRELLLGAQCKDSFEISRVFLVGGVNEFIHSFLVKHIAEQPLVWKSQNANMPEADIELVDGILDPKMIVKAGHPQSSQVGAWANALCDLRGGSLMFLVNAPDSGGRLPSTNSPERVASRDVPTQYIGNAPVNEFFYECTTTTNRSFLIKGQERDRKLQLVVQNNRTLASIFGELRLSTW
jgi:hypothetical protein